MAAGRGLWMGAVEKYSYFTLYLPSVAFLGLKSMIKRL